MNKYLLLLLISISLTGRAQYDMGEASDTSDVKENKINAYELKKHIYVGGDLSLAIGNPTYLYLGPFAGYDFYHGLSAGIGAMYQLYRVNLSSGNNIVSHAFGGSLFLRYRPEFFPYLYAQTEFNLYNTEDFTTPYSSDRTISPALMTGIAYSAGTGKMYYHIGLFYDFLQDINNPLPEIIPDIPLYYRAGLTIYLE